MRPSSTSPHSRLYSTSQKAIVFYHREKSAKTFFIFHFDALIKRMKRPRFPFVFKSVAIRASLK